MSQSKNIIVVGSINTDMVVMTERFPNPGETISAEKFFMSLGGKGANQAVAAARLGTPVAFLSRVGNDAFGSQAIKQLKSESIDVSCIQIDPELSSGVALITVDKQAENCIVAASGANACLTFESTGAFADKITENSIVVIQLEIPMQTIEKTCLFARSKNATMILNPAPAQSLTPEILAAVDIITPNQTEAHLLSGIFVTDEISANLAANKIRSYGPGVVIITMGSQGAYVCSDKESFMVPALTVDALDTTAAGDVFNGALAVGLSRDYSLKEAVSFASKAAAISVTRFGAQDSAPTAAELFDFNIKS
ncbi:ribokinase [Arcticibacter sp.]|uniref:ribokinase n=1 Tax=Arcticibacter sp. TaxID=1872630 RepID=UPI00388E6765